MSVEELEIYATCLYRRLNPQLLDDPSKEELYAFIDNMFKDRKATRQRVEPRQLSIEELEIYATVLYRRLNPQVEDDPSKDELYKFLNNMFKCVF